MNSSNFRDDLDYFCVVFVVPLEFVPDRNLSRGPFIWTAVHPFLSVVLYTDLLRTSLLLSTPPRP